MTIYDSILNLELGRNYLAEIAQGRNQPYSLQSAEWQIITNAKYWNGSWIYFTISSVSSIFLVCYKCTFVVLVNFLKCDVLWREKFMNFKFLM